MNTIRADVLDTEYLLLARNKVAVKCEACQWKGRRVVKVITNMVGDLWSDDKFTLLQHRITQDQQRAAAAHQMREMRSYPNCPKCGSDVYHA